MLTVYQIWVKEVQYTSVVGRYHYILTLRVPVHAQGSVSMSSIALVALIESCQKKNQGSPLGLDWQMIVSRLNGWWA